MDENKKRRTYIIIGIVILVVIAYCWLCNDRYMVVDNIVFDKWTRAGLEYNFDGRFVRRL